MMSRDKSISQSHLALISYSSMEPPASTLDRLLPAKMKVLHHLHITQYYPGTKSLKSSENFLVHSWTSFSMTLQSHNQLDFIIFIM